MQDDEDIRKKTMKIRILLSVLLLTLFTPAFSQDEPKYASKILFELDDSEYNLGNFEYYFLKNSERPSRDSAKVLVQEYLDLYVNFRLKVLEATNKGLDKEKTFIDEYEGYKKQLVEPFLTSKKFEEELIENVYERLQTEVAASHILLKVESGALPSDTLRIYNELLAIKDQVQNGTSFEQLAREKSEDPSAKSNAGRLGYFSALQMVYQFEDAAFENNVGDVVGPVRTRFGYHLLNITDKRPARGQLRASHIMIRHKSDSASIQKGKEKSEMIYKNLQNGLDWDQQCNLYSEDVNTAKNGGLLNWFSTGNIVPEFENAAFGLDSIGDISKPVMTRFGWHVIKLVDKKGARSYQEMKPELEKKIKRDERSRNQKPVMLASIKNNQGFALDSTVLKAAISKVDSTVLRGKWAANSMQNSSSQTLITMSEATFSDQDFYEFVEEKQRGVNMPKEDYLYGLYNQFEEQCIFEAEELFIEKNNRDYRLLLDEYRSGILLFNLMEEEVWGKSLEDSAGLRTYFDENRDAYQTKERVSVRRFVSKESKIITEVESMLDKPLMYLDSIFNSDEALSLQIDSIDIARGENVFLDANWAKGVYVETDENYTTLWVVDAVYAVKDEELENVRGQVISDYQTKLEEDWINRLKEKYPVKINKPVLKYFVKTFR